MSAATVNDVSKLGPLWTNELIHKVQSTRNRIAENMLLIKPDGAFAKQHQMVLDVADAMLAATDLLAALRLIKSQSCGPDWTPEQALAFIKQHAAEALAAVGAAPAAAAGWKSLNDVQWMNIVNHDHAFHNSNKEEAVHLAVKMVEAKLKEINAGGPA